MPAPPCTSACRATLTAPPLRAPPHPQIFARIVGALGGRAAEEVIFGDAEVTTGASGDLQQVRRGRGKDADLAQGLPCIARLCWDCCPQ